MKLEKFEEKYEKTIGMIKLIPREEISPEFEEAIQKILKEKEKEQKKKNKKKGLQSKK